MAGVNSIGSSDLFSFPTSDSKSTSGVSGNILSGVGTSLGDYSMIQSGAYSKLLKAYYAKNNASGTANAADGVDEKEKTALIKAKSDSTDLNSAVKKLMTTDITEETRESLKKNLKDVVESYNKLVDSGAAVDTKSVLRNMVWMTGSTAKNSGMLSEIGISIGEGNKLSLDEEKFDKAKLSDMKTLFQGVDSFMGKILQKSDAIAKIATTMSSSRSHASSYTNSGAYNTETSSTLYDSVI